MVGKMLNYIGIVLLVVTILFNSNKLSKNEAMQIIEIQKAIDSLILEKESCIRIAKEFEKEFLKNTGDEAHLYRIAEVRYLGEADSIKWVISKLEFKKDSIINK